MHANKIENRIKFKIKTWYYPKLLTRETMTTKRSAKKLKIR